MSGFWIDITDAAGTKYGEGPVRTAYRWNSLYRLDRAGTFAFEMPASDPRAAIVVEKRVARCMTPVGSAVYEVGSGIIDKVELVTSTDGAHILRVSGDDILRELTYRSVGDLEIGTESVPVTTGPADISAYFPSGWALDLTDGYNATAKAVWHKFEGESVLSALIKLVELTGEHFRLKTGRKIVWMKNDQLASGLLAVQGGDPVRLWDNTHVCLIHDLTREKDSFEMVSRVIPYGAGEGAAKITLSGTSWTPPSGYTLDAANNYIKRDATESGYARIERVENFKDVKNADMLAEMAYEWLERHSAAEDFYRMKVGKVDAALYPGTTLKVRYQSWVDGYHAIDIDDTLVVLEASTEVDVNGVRVTDLQVASVDRYPNNDANILASGLAQAQAFMTHAQPIDTNDLASDLPVANVSSLYDMAGDTKTIASGVITKGSAKITWHKVDTEGAAASDDLDTINGGAAGDLLFLSTVDSARDVVLKASTGNLRLTGDLTLAGAGYLACLLYKNSLWYEVSFSVI